ncbi:hypothetical protein FSBG_00136 [Fusobacterium gonidiaformans 3-1-5R]|uniref:DUF4325 domain-containing protein n=1 Tax=Fusobacterium gonidiaformans 3-1-5R TaxID=469605 RepID=E5BEV8_9FUSO|nr:MULTISPECIES: STAS-like domain-containing protein [Fusobacterium]EFS20639.1 hypothetical protein FSBG_00136 [Fusobacterium gonidiaformans 3-1-5R]KYM58527.1 hypothetical protein A2U09_07670 [Fusobacterium necrophorum subsp. funduliforme]
MKIKVFEIIGGQFAVSAEKGKTLYDSIVKNISLGEIPIILDFEGIEMTISTFFNLAYGELFKDYTEEEVEKLVKFENAKEISLSQIKQVKINALKLYRRGVD